MYVRLIVSGKAVVHYKCNASSIRWRRMTAVDERGRTSERTALEDEGHTDCRDY